MLKKKMTIHPSILSADYTNLQAELERVRNADAVHVDVMDNHFVPNLSIGAPVVAQIKSASPIPVDVHLMIDNPDYWAVRYAELGVDSVTFHAEAVKAPIRLARQLRRQEVKAAMALKPETPVAGYLPMLEELDMILIMTVEPGFGGQNFLKSTISKITAVRQAVENINMNIAIQVDGGITAETIVIAAEAGATSFVAGSAIYGAEDPAAAVEKLRQQATQSTKGEP